MRKLIKLFPLFLLVSIPMFGQDSVLVRTHYTKHEYRIVMRDGIELFTVVYVPRDTTELHPIMLTRTPYSVGPYGPDEYYRRLSNLQRKYFQRNYIMAYQDVRGRFMSGGEFVNVRAYIPNKKSSRDIDETTDTYDTIEWLIKNIPGNNGRVGVKGISYPGFYSTMATIDAHPAVKATSPQAPVSKWMAGDDFFHNGAFLVSHAFDFYVRFGWPRPKPTTTDFRQFNPGTPDGYQFYMDLGLLSNANKLYMKDSVAFWNDMMKHGKWDAFWEARDVFPHVKNLKPATLVVGGWFDAENLYGALNLYQNIEQKNRNNQNMLVMGPWAHGWWAANDVDSLGPIKFGMNLSDFFADTLELPFFEHYLREKERPELAEATVFETGSNRWHRLDSWPPKNAHVRNLYLRENGALSFSMPDPGGSEFDEYLNDPAKPVPYTNEITTWYNAAFMVEDQRFASRRPDVLVYETDPLQQEVTIAGPMTVDLIVSTSGSDCDWIVKLIDVFPDDTPEPASVPGKVKFGGYQMLVRGDVLRGKFRNSLANPESFIPDTLTKVSFILQDAFHTFKKGHRIMVQIQSSWFPLIDRNPGKFLDIYSARESDYQRTRQRIYRTSANPSFLRLIILE
ncbi:MAG: CocE/NonD family hydrolase [Ignavibacteriales bacterium]|nr:CocE/NonD family hydrolase [Ignavibacteriales bacterium]